MIEEDNKNRKEKVNYSQLNSESKNQIDISQEPLPNTDINVISTTITTTTTELIESNQTNQSMSIIESHSEITETENEHVLLIHHLDKFKLPPGYPQSIADIIREISSSSDLIETLLPKKLTQILKIR